jgi:uncharacterized protein YkwD
MTRASAAAPVRVRLVVTATVLAMAVAVVLVGRADGAGQAWSAYLAPSDVCPGANDRGAAASLQARSVRCLVNWARAQEQRPGLRPSRALRRAAELKGRGVASCGELSHAPCSSRVTDAVRQSGYRYSSFGENLFAGIDRHVSPRDVVAAWLQSPPHRANILRPGFREVGFASVSAPGFFGVGGSVVWVAAFGARK